MTSRKRLSLSPEGLVPEARQIDSPNCDERPGGMAVELLVLHNISLPPGEFGGEGIVKLFTNTLDPRAHPYYASIAHLRVAAHFLIRRDGELIQFVACTKRAWHAGVSQWQGREHCNDFSVGIELEGTDQSGYTNAQYTRLGGLTRLLARTYPIAAVVGHSDIAPGRKTDPGPGFDWTRLDWLKRRPSSRLDKKRDRADNEKLC
ncbi:MAG: 1,6-anhydro-N-acetylmuramyl-L-alanine amidase AmpD [Betaproteobacteria bacterium]|nr:1,6-anhydro-N-acetylmuramyl-L-alanine amidase AmpD [Betaproteobacteria bacterium]